jgi:hypothetical protein
MNTRVLRGVLIYAYVGAAVAFPPDSNLEAEDPMRQWLSLKPTALIWGAIFRFDQEGGAGVLLAGRGRDV